MVQAELDSADAAINGRLRGDDTLSYAFPAPPANDFSRIPANVALGVIASGSIFRWMIDGFPEARAAAKAAGKSALFSTTAP